MAAKIKFKRGTTSSWASSEKDNTLAQGQPGLEIRSGKPPRLKIGTDSIDTVWSSVDYVTPDAAIYTDIGIVDPGDSTFSIGSSSTPIGDIYAERLNSSDYIKGKNLYNHQNGVEYRIPVIRTGASLPSSTTGHQVGDMFIVLDATEV